LIHVLDRAELVLIGAEAVHADPALLLHDTDIVVLMGIERRLRAAATVTEAAAAALVGIAAGRPFPGGAGSNRAAAWLAATHLAALNARSVEIDEDAAVALVAAAQSGVRDERAVATALDGCLRRPAGRVRRALRVLAAGVRPAAVPPPPPPVCPLCGRTLDPARLWLASRWHPVTRHQAIQGCLRQHRAHDAGGTSRPARASAAAEPTGGSAMSRRPSFPVVVGPASDRPRAFVALTDRAPVAFRPVGASSGGPPAPATYDLIPLRELSVSDLTGSWDRLWAGSEPVARVTLADEAVPTGPAGLDWRHVRAVAGPFDTAAV
jgi:hypothetical protein